MKERVFYFKFGSSPRQGQAYYPTFLIQTRCNHEVGVPPLFSRTGDQCPVDFGQSLACSSNLSLQKEVGFWVAIISEKDQIIRFYIWHRVRSSGITACTITGSNLTLENWVGKFRKGFPKKGTTFKCRAPSEVVTEQSKSVRKVDASDKGRFLDSGFPEGWGKTRT